MLQSVRKWDWGEPHHPKQEPFQEQEQEQDGGVQHGYEENDEEPL